MQAIRRKLNSQKGASMLMALLLMLVGIMVSAVIISAATSAAVNKRSEKEQQQAYLAVSSAAELVRDDFQSLTGRYKDVTTTVTHADGTTTTTNDTIKATCAVGDMINDIGARFIGVNTTSTYAKTYTFSVDGYEDVSAEILVSVGTGSDESSKVYNLTATFTNGVGSEHPCRMVLTMEGKLTEERTSGDTGSTQVVTRTLEWNKAKLQKLRSQKAETLVETLMAIVVVVLVMLFLSTAVSTASKVNAKVRKTDVALTYKNAVKGSETKTLIIKDKNSATKIIHVQVDEYTSENGYTYYRESKEQGART